MYILFCIDKRYVKAVFPKTTEKKNKFSVVIFFKLSLCIQKVHGKSHYYSRHIANKLKTRLDYFNSLLQHNITLIQKSWTHQKFSVIEIYGKVKRLLFLKTDPHDQI